MHKEILNKKQTELINLVEYFSARNFYLAGGTALALQIGHRESIDFDLFSFNEFNNQDIYKGIKECGIEDNDLKVIIDKLDEYTLFISDVKFTFLRYPFLVKDFIKRDKMLLADDLTIGAMKAYALGRRGKWKDYIDLYFLLQKYSISDIFKKANDIFGSLFSEKMFLQQLCYFKDIDYTESVKWRIKNPPSDNDIKIFLEKKATDLIHI